jgi:hypothetical protein
VRDEEEGKVRVVCRDEELKKTEKSVSLRKLGIDYREKLGKIKFWRWHQKISGRSAKNFVSA